MTPAPDALAALIHRWFCEAEQPPSPFDRSAAERILASPKAIAAFLAALAPAQPAPTGLGTHYVCAKGNDHWLSHVRDWDGDQTYSDGCRVHITVEGGHQLHLTVLDAAQPAPTPSPTCCELACYEDPGCTCAGCAPAQPEPTDEDWRRKYELGEEENVRLLRKQNHLMGRIEELERRLDSQPAPTGLREALEQHRLVHYDNGISYDGFERWAGCSCGWNRDGHEEPDFGGGFETLTGWWPHIFAALASGSAGEENHE